LRQADDWVRVDCDKKALLNKHSALEIEMNKRFDSTVTDFMAENETSYQIKTQRVSSIFDRRIEQDKQRIRTLREANRSPKVIQMAEGRLKTGMNNKEKRLHELADKAKVDMEQAQVAAGVFRVSEH
jgi:nucleoside phosphorylase